MTEKKIIIFILLLALVSSVYLSFVEIRQQDSDVGKNWWSVSFADPKNSSSAFVIENHGDENLFKWEIFDDGEMIDAASFNIARGNSKSFIGKTEGFSGKILIRVTAGSDKKEIYKIIE